MNKARFMTHRLLRIMPAAALSIGVGCGQNATLLNPAFVNFAVGGIVPLAPTSASGFVLVRVVNNTAANIRFVVTAERSVEVTDENGVVTVELQKETRRIQTFPVQLANDVGILFDCPVDRVGLGEEIDFPATEPALFVGAIPGQSEGFGVPGNVNPLDAGAGNFVCGDTLIFQAFVSAGTVGNVSVDTFRIQGAEQADTGINTFVNARSAIDQLTLEE